MVREATSKNKIISFDMDSCFSAFLDQLDSIAILLDHDFNLVNLNVAAQKYYKTCLLDILGKNFSTLEKNGKVLNSLDKIKRDPDNSIKLISLSSESKEGDLPISWLFTNLKNLHKSSGYLIVGQFLLPKQHIDLQNKRIKNYLKEISACIPGNFYWKDTEGRYLGYNQGFGETFSLKSEDIIEKTDDDFWPKQAKELRKNDIAVMEADKPCCFEEMVQIKDREPMYFTVIKMPLRDIEGKTIGIMGGASNVTYRKKAEHLKLENGLQKNLLQEQGIFKALASQVAHDIRSPLASLSIIVESCKSIPEADRIALRKAATSIGDIANNLLCKYRESKLDSNPETQLSKPIGVHLVLSEILSEKKYQYKYSPVEFSYFADKDSSFVSINMELANFNRMISNLIDNSVDAFGGKGGKVDLELKSNNKLVKIIIKDNGKGISPKVIEKIMDNVAVTSGKITGNGLDLTQVREMLQRNQGTWSIESKIGVGTKITIIFPRVETSDWMVDQIKLTQGDTIIILDDDSSIHHAWETRLKPYEPDVKLKHFELGREVVEFINTATSKNKIFLLADFELIDQELNGLEVIKQTEMQQHSILVTSHYNDTNVHDLAVKIGVKILPKQLVSNVSINIEKEDTANSNNEKVDLIVVDDDRLFADSLAGFFRNRDMVVNVYYSPQNFLKKLTKYDKKVKICLDNDFRGQMNGIELAQQLNKVGYKNLYMLSGRDFEEGEIPGYLKTLVKGDMDGLKKIFEE